MGVVLVLGSVINPPQYNRRLAPTALLHGVRHREKTRTEIHQHTHLLSPGSALHHTLQDASAGALPLGVGTIPCHHSFCVPPCVPKVRDPFFKPCAVPSEPHRSLQPGRYHISKKKKIFNFLFIDGKVLLHLLSGIKKHN